MNAGTQSGDEERMDRVLAEVSEILGCVLREDLTRENGLAAALAHVVGAGLGTVSLNEAKRSLRAATARLAEELLAEVRKREPAWRKEVSPQEPVPSGG